MTQAHQRNLKGESPLRERFAVVIGELTLIDWLSQIHVEISTWLTTTGSRVRITKLQHALRFTLAGRVFAMLRIDDQGLLFRCWEFGGRHQEHIGLHLDVARGLVKQSISATEGAATIG